MIKDVFVLKRDAWHAKLMKYIWGFRPSDFSHICPYFWLSICNLLIILVLFPIKELLRLVVRFCDFMTDLMDKWKTSTEQKYITKIINDPDARSRFIELRQCNKKRYTKIMDHFYYNNSEIYYLIANKATEIELEEHRNVKEKRDQQWREELKHSRVYTDKPVKTAKQQINSLLKVIQPFIRFLLIAITLVVVYYLAIFLIWIYGILVNIPAQDWQYAWQCVLIGLSIAAIVIAAFFVVGAIILLLKEARFRLNLDFCWCKPIINFIATPFKWIAEGIFWIVSGVGAIAMIIVQMIKNNCPAIDWE